MQVRNGSTRLPQKMTRPLYEGKGIFELLLERMISYFESVPIIVATTTNENDTAIADIAESKGVMLYRGSENDVLDRFINAAEAFDIDNVIRICADNPLLDMQRLELMIKASELAAVDYWCYATSDGLPTIKTGYGFWGEAVTKETLKCVWRKTDDTLYREHVTNFIYTHPEEFKIHYEVIDPEVEQHSNIRLTVDTANDFNLMKEIYAEIQKENIPIQTKPLVEMIAKYPKWRRTMNLEMQKNLK
jgi:spore coat polysaccharide biosynthesis protein SpsF